MRRRHARAGWARAVAITAALAAAVVAVPPHAATAAVAEPLTDHSVQVSVDDVSPSTPAQSYKPKPLSIRLTLTNTTDQSFASVRVDVVRGTPINRQQDLEAAITQPHSPDPSLAAPVPTASGTPLTTALGAKSAVPLTFVTSTEIPVDTGLCLCADAIYPLYITVHTTDTSGNDVTIGTAQTYLPSFSDSKSARVGVSWVWPLIDRPHRLVGDTQFLDDDLASSVDGGRMDRVLAVAEAVAANVPLTLVIDPELIDELAVMAAGKYQVSVGNKLVDGAGTAAARAWLGRLKAVIDTPGIRVSFTAPADPDIVSFTDAQPPLTWTAAPSQAMQTRIDSALGSRSFTPSLVWPVGETVDQATLDAVARQGATGVIVNDTTLPPADTADPVPGIATVQTTSGSLAAYVTSRTVERYVAPALTLGGPGLSVLPQLVAEVAIRSVQPSTTHPFVVITPPRLVNPDVQTATRTIVETARAYWASGLPLQIAQQSISPSERRQLAPQFRSGLSSLTLAALRSVGDRVPALSTLFSSNDASAVIGDLPSAAQRAGSSSWEAPVGSTTAATSDEIATTLLRRVATIEDSVQIIKPSSGTYTLAASNSPLPLTIWNKLAVPVTVQIEVKTENGLPGFTADLLPPQVIAAGVKRQMQIPAHVNRTGRFVVAAQLLTPAGQSFGDPVRLSVRSTALGTVGVVITVVAGAVLVLALLIRVVSRLRKRGKTQQPSPVVIE